MQLIRHISDVPRSMLQVAGMAGHAWSGVGVCKHVCGDAVLSREHLPEVLQLSLPALGGHAQSSAQSSSLLQEQDSRFTRSLSSDR